MLYLPKEQGQGLVEYAFILVLVAIVVIIILAAIGGGLNGMFARVNANLTL